VVPTGKERGRHRLMYHVRYDCFQRRPLCMIDLCERSCDGGGILDQPGNDLLQDGLYRVLTFHDHLRRDSMIVCLFVIPIPRDQA
jgi:hypothetical protein